MHSPELTILNLYDLKGTSDAFQTAVERLVKRVEAEGDPGVLAYNFFVNEAAESARAVIDYTNCEAWFGHHDIAMAWPEMKAMHHVAHLREVVFLGSFTPEIQTWLERAGLTVRLDHGNRFASGFRRTIRNESKTASQSRI